MENVNGIGKINGNKPVSTTRQNTTGSVAGSINAKREAKPVPEGIFNGNGPVDMTEFTDTSATATSARSKKIIEKALSGFEKNKVPAKDLKGILNAHFMNSNSDDRQELVVNLFSDNSDVKSLVGLNFARLNPKSPDYTPFDEAARYKALMSARDHLKKEPGTDFSTKNYIETLGYVGNDKDLPLLLSLESEVKNPELEPSLGTTLVKSTGNILGRNPESLDHKTAKPLAEMISRGIGSENNDRSEASVSLLMSQSENRDLRESFNKTFKDIPHNEQSAKAFGRFAGNLISNNPETVTFTSLVLDGRLKDADKNHKSTLLKEASLYFDKYIDRNNENSARDVMSVLGGHFEDVLPAKKGKKFSKLSAPKKLDQMIKHYKQD